MLPRNGQIHAAVIFIHGSFNTEYSGLPYQVSTTMHLGASCVSECETLAVR